MIAVELIIIIQYLLFLEYIYNDLLYILCLYLAIELFYNNYIQYIYFRTYYSIRPNENNSPKNSSMAKDRHIIHISNRLGF